MLREKTDASKPVWNSLEVAKLLVSVLTPAMVFWFGITLKHVDDARAARERSQEAAQKHDEAERDRQQAKALQDAVAARQEQERRDAIRRAATDLAAKNVREDEIRASERRHENELRQRDEQHRAEVEAAERARDARVDEEHAYQERQEGFRSVVKLATAWHHTLDNLRDDIDRYSGDSIQKARIQEQIRIIESQESDWDAGVETALTPFKRSISAQQFERLDWITHNDLGIAYKNFGGCLKKEWTWKSSHWFQPGSRDRTPEFSPDSGCQLLVGHLVMEELCRGDYVYYLSDLASRGRAEIEPPRCADVEQTNRAVMRITIENLR